MSGDDAIECPFHPEISSPPDLGFEAHSNSSFFEAPPHHKDIGKAPLTPANPTAFNRLLFSCAVNASYVFRSVPPTVPGSCCRAGGPLARAEGREVGVARLGGIFGLGSGWSWIDWIRVQ